jgi:hypothetical protein
MYVNCEDKKLSEKFLSKKFLSENFCPKSFCSKRFCPNWRFTKSIRGRSRFLSFVKSRWIISDNRLLVLARNHSSCRSVGRTMLKNNLVSFYFDRRTVLKNNLVFFLLR